MSGTWEYFGLETTILCQTEPLEACSTVPTDRIRFHILIAFTLKTGVIVAAEPQLSCFYKALVY